MGTCSGVDSGKKPGRVRRFLGGLAGACITVLFAGGLWIVANSWDAWAPDSMDLVPDRSPVDDSANAFTWFRQAAAICSLPANAADPFGVDLVEHLAGDDARATEVLTANREVFSRMQTGLQRPACRLPVPASHRTALDSVGSFRAVAQIMAVRAAFERRRGDLRGSANTSRQIIAFGETLQAGAECDLHYRVGTSIRDIGLAGMRVLATEPGASWDFLTSLARALVPSGTPDAGWVRALQGEYGLMDAGLTRLEADEASVSGMTAVPFVWLPSSYRFQPNRTRRQAAVRIRRMIGEAASPLSGVSGIDPAKPGFVSYVLMPNSVGRMMSDNLATTLNRFVLTRIRAEAVKSGTCLMLACRAYAKVHGVLPAKLEQLVPDFLPAIPRDPGTGEAFGFLAEERVLYSSSGPDPVTINLDSGDAAGMIVVPPMRQAVSVERDAAAEGDE